MIALPGASRLCRALGDETRLRILHLLREEELSCGDLMEILNAGQSRVSTHLTLLKEVGLVQDRRAGRRNLYSLVPGGEAELLQRLLAEAADCAGVGARRRATSIASRRRSGSRSCPAAPGKGSLARCCVWRRARATSTWGSGTAS